jgi:FtsH-binding integral membrane protein
MNSVLAVLLLATAGFCFGGAYAMFTQKKPLWSVILLVLLGTVALAGGWLYL